MTPRFARPYFSACYPACWKQRRHGSTRALAGGYSCGLEDSSVQYVPEPQLITALEIAPETRRYIQAMVRRYCPELEAVIVSERRHELELVRLGPGRNQRSLGRRLRATGSGWHPCWSFVRRTGKPIGQANHQTTKYL